MQAARTGRHPGHDSSLARHHRLPAAGIGGFPAFRRILRRFGGIALWERQSPGPRLPGPVRAACLIPRLSTGFRGCHKQRVRSEIVHRPGRQTGWARGGTKARETSHSQGIGAAVACARPSETRTRG